MYVSAIEMLEDIRLKEIRIMNLQDDYAKRRIQIYYLQATELKHDVVHGSSTNTSNADVDAVLDIALEIKRAYKDLYKLETLVFSKLEMLQNPNYMRMLYLRYFCQKNNVSIAEDLRVSTSWVSRMHSKALQDFQNILDKDIDAEKEETFAISNRDIV